MGLDNGIVIEHNSKILKMKHAPKKFEICYWRKCYNIRDAIVIDVLGENYDPDEGGTYLTVENLYDTVEILKGYNKHNWDASGVWTGSIWTWKEIKRDIKRNIRDLKKVIKLKEKYDIDVYFYDSY